MEKIKGGIPLKEGQIVRVEGWDADTPEGDGGLRAGVYEVERDVDWWPDFNSWGSVKLVGVSFYVFTHKGGIEVVK